MGLDYEQVHVKVEIDAKDEYAAIDVLQPLQTLASDQDVRVIRADRDVTNGTLGFSVGPTTARVAASGNVSKETSSSTESREYHSRITERHLDGVISWGFSVDDMHERQKGVELKASQRALPSVEFKFFGPSDDHLPPPPDHFGVLVASCWSLISSVSDSNTPSRRWLRWFKRPSPLEMAAPRAPLYSNLCPAVILEVPSHLSQASFYKSVMEVTQDSRKPVLHIKRPGPHTLRVTPSISFPEGSIRSGKSHSSFTNEILPKIFLYR